MRLLLFHNTMPEYRIQWFQEIAKRCDVSFVFTNDSVYEKLYHNKTDYSLVDKLDCTFLKPGFDGFYQLKQILKNISGYDFVLYPPTDSFRELLMSLMIRSSGKGIKTGYFWEKWEAPKEKQRLKRKLKNWILGTAAKMVYGSTDVVFSGGSKSREYFIQHGCDKNKIVYLPDSCEAPDCDYIDIRAKYEIPQDKKIILYFGRLLEQKGLDILIRAFAELNNEYWLLVAGNGELMSKCVQMSKGLLNITFAGQVDPKIRKNFFEQCDLFVFPGTFRGGRVDVWGLTLNEAISAGKPVVSTNAVGSAYDLIDEGMNGFRIEPENVVLLRHAIEEAIQIDPEIVKETNERKMKVYNFENMAEVLVNKASEA